MKDVYKRQEQFCKAHFPGHQALICTHPDGHNHSGNIHVHIVINSLRIYEVPLLSYMDRPADTREGCKHRCTNAAMEYFKSEVMEMCHREGLYQIDLLNGSKERITEREYWAAKNCLLYTSSVKSIYAMLCIVQSQIISIFCVKAIYQFR